MQEFQLGWSGNPGPDSLWWFGFRLLGPLGPLGTLHVGILGLEGSVRIRVVFTCKFPMDPSRPLQNAGFGGVCSDPLEIYR